MYLLPTLKLRGGFLDELEVSLVVTLRDTSGCIKSNVVHNFLPIRSSASDSSAVE